MVSDRQLHLLDNLLQEDDFIRRHIGPDKADIKEMLAKLKVKDLDELIKQTVPAKILSKEPLAMAGPLSENYSVEYLREMMSRNIINRSMIGLGYYDCHIPAVILRNLLENPGWYTAYTPYQAEISQGRLELLLNFQQMIVDLTGMDVANASLLDEATAAAEAMTLAKRSPGVNKSDNFFVSNKCFPQTLSLLKTRSAPLGIKLTIGDIKDYKDNPADYFGVLLQYPDLHGEVNDLSVLAELVHSNNALLCVATDLLSLILLRSPGEMNADIVFGNSQRFGVPLGFGGPHAAFFAVREKLQRSMPGRLIGVSVDSKDKPALRMALQTREQHIRRDKATSNICTAQVLLANMASLYAAYHGYEGLSIIAKRVNRLASLAALFTKEAGYEPATDNFFDTVSLITDKAAGLAIDAAKAGYNFCVLDSGKCLQLSFDETSTINDLITALNILGCKLDKDKVIAADNKITAYSFDAKFLRQDEILSHPVFKQHQTETKMMRYLRKLQQKDIGLDRSMIALGSCTMKLNAASEMVPISWPEINRIHPFAPTDQTMGYAKFIDELEDMLKEITGFASVSFQPNSGAQGEYAGLLAIRSYHAKKGDTERDICLIPSSSHGTNPASAVMAGMKVVVVSCDDKGNVNVEDMKAKIAANEDKIAALMITYPSTHGVFEESIKEICDLIHKAGGQVYMDGANLNAMVGITRPADIGADVCHINLHKTFCIPHGGGGPGMGPIGVAPQLVEFLPRHWASGKCDDLNSVSAAPYGSASILAISWAYIKMMGGAGLTRATKVAILNANYIATVLGGHYPVLYKGVHGRNAHECIFDIRAIKKASGISEEDIAKRLIDYGFHAPTMSFPVSGTLMVEPTESESKDELDRFCAAMIQIRKEITEVEEGKLPLEDNPLVNAPHSLADLYGDWNHPYSKDQAFRPLNYLKDDKYFPPVNRVNNPHGDKNLFCVCPPMEEYS